MTPAAQPPPASKYTFKNLSCAKTNIREMPAKWNNQPDMAALVVSPQPNVDNKAMPSSAESTMPLASGFQAVGEADWLALLRKSAPGKSSSDLATESDDGISVGPFYIPDTSGEIVTSGRSGGWQIVQRIDCKEVAAALRQIEEDIAGGATAIELVFASSPWARGTGLDPGVTIKLNPIADLLRQNAVAVRVDAGEDTAALTTHLLGRITSGVAEGKSITAAFDLYATMAMQGGLRRSHAELAGGIVDLFAGLERSGLSGSAFIADGRLWHAGGASEALELAAAIAAYVAALRLFEDRRIDLARAAARIGLALAADADQFLTMAKFRAARLLVGRVLDSIGIEAPLVVHAETAWRMMSRDDAHTNIVRATTAALAAGLGGADSVTVLPFDSAARSADRFARRIARNSQTILIQEASLARVADPGAGAGALEALTDRLAEKAWDRFRAIEAEGGLLSALRAGTLQRAVAAVRERRLHRLLTRALPLTGVTSHPAIAMPSEALAAMVERAPPLPLGETVEPLVAIRLSEPFELLRESADRLALSGNRPTVFLVTLGRPSQTAAVSSEARQLFASGGIAVVAAGPLASAEAAGTAFVASKSEIACICAAATTGEEDLAAVAGALRAQAPIALGLAGRAAATPSMFDYIVEDDSNVVELLGAILEKIAASRKNFHEAQ